MRVYLVRHGQSTSNLLQNRQGGDCELTTLGIAQAKKLAARLTRLPCDVIITSDYARALQTTEIIQKRLAKKLITTPLLREEKDPSEIEGIHMHNPEVLRIQELRDSKRNKANWRYSDEENFFDLKERTEKLLKFLEKRKEENILLVGHVQLFRMLAGAILFGDHLTPDLYQKMRERLLLRHTGISIFDYTNGTWKLISWNDHTHLRPLQQ